MSGKVGTSANKMICVKGAFLWWRLCIPSIRTIAYVADKQSVICRIYGLLQGLCASSVKTTTYVYNIFKIEFFSNLNGKFWNKSTLILLGFLGVCSNQTSSFKTIPSLEFANIYYNINYKFAYTSCINDFFDRSLF